MYAADKSLQLCPTLCDPTDSSPPGSPISGILQARILEWGAIAFSAGGWIVTCKRMKLDHFLTLYTKINLNWIRDLNTSGKAIQFLDLGLGNGLLDLISKS